MITRRNKWMVTGIAAILAGLMFARPCAAADDDTQIWSSITVVAGVAPKLDLTLEVHARFTEDASVFGQRLIRPSLTYKLRDNLSFSAGYVHVVNNTSTALSSNEQRAWEQIGYVFRKTKSGTSFSGRTRLEQRFVENTNDTGWRLRQQLRLETPLPQINGVRGLLWNETFVGLNKTSWGQRSTIDQTRNFAGIAVPVASNATLEPGYLNQIIFRNGTDRMNHIAAVSLIVKF